MPRYYRSGLRSSCRRSASHLPPRPCRALSVAARVNAPPQTNRASTCCTGKHILYAHSGTYKTGLLQQGAILNLSFHLREFGRAEQSILRSSHFCLELPVCCQCTATPSLPVSQLIFLCSSGPSCAQRSAIKTHLTFVATRGVATLTRREEHCAVVGFVSVRPRCEPDELWCRVRGDEELV